MATESISTSHASSGAVYDAVPFAMMEAQLIVAMIAQHHRLALVSGHDVTLHPVTTLRPKNGVRVILQARPQKPDLLRNLCSPVRVCEASPGHVS